MFKKSYASLIFFVLITYFSIYSLAHSMEGEGFQPRAGGTSIKENRKDYEGYSLTESDKQALTNVPVQLCTSLGKSCATKISEYIDHADEFVVVFMYRFNSPTIINSLSNKYFEHKGKMPILVFLDYNQSIGTQAYHNYIKQLITNVPTTLVKAGSKPFHQKVTICKQKDKEAFVILGSANATFEADNIHSEDSIIIQSNKLASIYVGEFYKFLKMKIHSSSKQVITFHEHRFEDGVSNTNYLEDILETLKENEQKSTVGSDIYISNIVSLGISTGFTLGNTKCFDVFKNAIKKEKTSPLILFENYLTIPPEVDQHLWELLLNATPKLIVLNKDKSTKEKSNFNSIQVLKEQSKNKVLLFRPYTGGKFHHKLLINYPKEESDLPIIYTGSFHLSNNAITNNSENIIGIASEKLAENYIASILWQSALANQQEVWKFINEHPKTFSSSAPLQEVATKIFLQTNLSIKKIPYQFKYLMEKLLLIEGTFFRDIKEFKEKFTRKLGLEKIAKVLFPQEESEKVLNMQDRISLFKEAKLIIFNCPINQYISGLFVNLHDVKAFIKNIPILGDELSDKAIEVYLDDLEEWIKATQMMLELKKYKNRNDIDDIKKQINAVNHIHGLLKQACNFSEELQNYLSFNETIIQTGFLELDNSIIKENIKWYENQIVGQDQSTVKQDQSPTNEFCEFIRFLVRDAEIPEKEIRYFLKSNGIAQSSITKIIKGNNLNPENAFTAEQKLKKKYYELFEKWVEMQDIHK